jgi:hypothetical protein
MRRALAIFSVGMTLMLLPAAAFAAGPGRILGTVTPTGIAPEVEVCLVESRPSEYCTSPAADGTYVLPGLPVETPLKVDFIPSHRSGYLPQYFDDVTNLAQAQVLIIPAAKTIEKEVLTEIDATLRLGGSIKGTVTASSGGPLAEVEVCVLQTGGACTETDDAGEYILSSLPSGSYKIGFWGRGASAEYAPQYYEGQSTIAQATPVSVTAGEITTGIDAVLAKGAQVTGAVAAASTGARVEGVPVCLFAMAAATPTRCVYTGIGGTYSLVGLAPGAYQVGFSLGSAEIGGESISSEDDGYFTQYYHGVANRSEAQVLNLSAPAPAAPIVPPPPVGSNIVPAPPLIVAPTKPRQIKCKKGFAKKKVKGVTKCTKKVPPKRPHKKSKAHGKSTKKRHARDQR